MKYLLDTHAIIWALTDTKKLPKKTKDILQNPDNEIIVSTISFWEISLKHSLGKLDLDNFAPEDFPSACLAMDFKILPLDAAISSTFHKLKATHHRDPFDRMLIHLSLKINISLISKDENVKLYESEGLKVIWN
jgi:PIN domain nuclease of toxin-antitoxin system